MSDEQPKEEKLKAADYFTHIYGEVVPRQQRANIAFELSQNYAVFVIRSAVFLNTGSFGVLAVLVTAGELNLQQITSASVYLILGTLLGLASATASYLNLQYLSVSYEGEADKARGEVNQFYINDPKIKVSTSNEIERLKLEIDKNGKKIACSFWVAIILILSSYACFLRAALSIAKQAAT